ncbi:MAG: serine/threonine-protein kinase [Planctomycetaceae bacterium]|nr:serine/threonine-protein kinase [Planctomycetaceae bacterium]
MTDTTSDRNPIDVLGDEFSARLREGSTPSIDEYADSHPELADDIRATFPSIVMMEKLSRKEHTERKFERQTSRLLGDSQETLGDFQIVREIGRGGMGIVYEAVEQSLKRRVALKVLGPNFASSQKQVQRFNREAEAAARLHHTNIVPVYATGEERDLHFFAMQFIDGIPLSAVIRSVGGRSAKQNDSAALGSGSLADRLLTPTSNHDDSRDSLNANEKSDSTLRFKAELAAKALLTGTHKNRVFGSAEHSSFERTVDIDGDDSQVSNVELVLNPEEPTTTSVSESELPTVSMKYWRNVARIGFAVADALNYSHQHGVLHRDIKPSNLLLDRQGVVWVTDFGLARHEDQEGITNTGEIVGTLRYMAPEQFSGESTTRSDIYSLGLTIYELLAMRPAFEESRHGPLISQKTNSTPPGLRSINAGIPRDLETISQKASATNPADRYATAGELAADLRRFLEDRPVLARRATTVEQLVRWARRNPTVASLTGATVTLLAAVAGVFAVGQHRTQAALDIVGAQKSQLEERQVQLDESLLAEQNSSRLARAEFARAEQNLQLAIEAFDSIIDNVASRGVPQSLTLDLGDDEPGDAEPRFYDTMLTAADADLLEKLLAFFDDFASQNRTDLRLQSASARKRVGDIQQRLGRFDEAEETYRQSLKAFEALFAQKPEDLQLVIAQARIHNEIAIAVSRRGAMWGAVEQHSRAKDLLQKTSGVMETSNGKLELARTLGLMTTIGARSGMSALMAMSRTGSSNGRPPSDGRPRGDSRRERERGPNDEPGKSRSGDGQPRPDRSSAERPDGDRSEGSRRGSGARSGFRNWSEMFIKSSDQSLALLTELLNGEPSRPDYRLELAIAWRNRANVARIVNDQEMGKEAIATAINHLTELARDFPEESIYRFELADTLCIRSSRNSDTEPLTELLQRVRRAIVLCEGLIERYPNVTEYQALMGTSLGRQAMLLRRLEDFGLAAESFHLAIDLQQPLAERFASVSLYQVAYLQSLWGLSEISVAQKDPATAVGFLETAIDRLQILLSNAPKNRMLEHYLEKLRRRRGELARPSAEETPPASTTAG